jgi:Protein of unknown function (DUF3768)
MTEGCDHTTEMESDQDAGYCDVCGGKARALIQVQRFTSFNADNDPHGEHDFGSFEVAGEKFFWKIDYYDSDMTSGSEDPADPEKTRRGSHRHACRRVLSPCPPRAGIACIRPG